MRAWVCLCMSARECVCTGKALTDNNRMVEGNRSRSLPTLWPRFCSPRGLQVGVLSQGRVPGSWHGRHFESHHEELKEKAAHIRTCTHTHTHTDPCKVSNIQHTKQFQRNTEEASPKPNRTSIRPGSSSMNIHWPSEEANRAILMRKARLNWAGKRHKWVKAAANHSITNDRWAWLNPACLMLCAEQQVAGT